MLPNSTYAALAVILIAAAVRRTERRIIEELEAAGAVTPEQAIALRLDSWLRKSLFRRLLNGGAVGETQEMKQYLDVVGLAAYHSRRRKRAFVVLAIGAILLSLIYLKVFPFASAPTP